MTASRPTAGSRSIPWGLLGGVALMAVVEAFVARHELTSFTTNSAASWRQAGRAAKGPAAKAEVLCFGDSMVKFGVAPRVIESELGVSTYNLAPYGGPPAASYVLLHRALEAGARPRAVVVDFMPHVLAVAPRFHSRLWQEMATPREAFDLALTSRNASFFAELMLGRAVPSIRTRSEVRDGVLKALGNISLTNVVAHYVTPLWRNWRINHGGQVLAKNDYDGRARPGDKALFPDDWRCDRANAAYMRRFLDLAAARDIPVIWLLPPMSPATQALRERRGDDAFLTGLTRRVQSRYPNVVVVDARRAGFPHRVFTDPVHLDREGTTALSQALAGVLARCLKDADGPRWVALPPFRGTPGSPLEDTDQSRLALKANPETRRR